MADSYRLKVKKIGNGAFDVMSKATEPDQDWSDEDGVDVPDGTKITVRGVADDGNVIDYISENGTPTFNNTKLTMTMPKNDLTIVVAFKKKAKADKPKDDEPKTTMVLVETEGKGEVILNVPNNPVAKTGRPFQITTGENFTIMATKPAKGYEYAHILGGKSALMLPIQPVKAEGANMALKVVFEKIAPVHSHDDHEESTGFWAWANGLAPWNSKSKRPHGGNQGVVMSDRTGINGLVLLLIALAGVIWYQVNYGQKNIDKASENETQERCLKAAEKGIMLKNCEIESLPPTKSADSGNVRSATAQGNRSSCPAIDINGYTVYDGTARKGCTITVTGGLDHNGIPAQAMLKGKFTVTTISGHPFAAFINLRCNDFTHGGTPATFVKTGSGNDHDCVILSKPSDAPETATIVATAT